MNKNYFAVVCLFILVFAPLSVLAQDDDIGPGEGFTGNVTNTTAEINMSDEPGNNTSPENNDDDYMGIVFFYSMTILVVSLAAMFIILLIMYTKLRKKDQQIISKDKNNETMT